MKNLNELVSKSTTQQQPVESKNTKVTVRKRTSRFIARTKYDDMAKRDLTDIKDNLEDCIRPAFKIPASKYVDVRQVCGLKRQTFQEFAWALVLQELARLERMGVLVPPHKQTFLEE